LPVNTRTEIGSYGALLDRGWGRPTQPLAGNAAEPPVGIEISREELARRAREEIDEAFREYRPPGREEERVNGPVIECRSSPAQDGDRGEPVAKADHRVLPPVGRRRCSDHAVHRPPVRGSYLIGWKPAISRCRGRTSLTASPTPPEADRLLSVHAADRQ